MLRKRLIASAIIISVLLGLIYLDFYLGADEVLGRPGIVLAPLVVVLLLMASAELISLLEGGGLQVRKWSTMVGVQLVFVFSVVPIVWRDYPADCAFGKSGWTLIGIAAAIGLAFMAEMAHFKEPGESVQKISSNLFALGYLGVLASFFAALRFFHDNVWGMIAVLSLIIVCKFADSAAYFFGKTMGKHKLAPILSPKKTAEGLWGSFFGGIIASAFVFYILTPLMTGASIAENAKSTKIIGVLIYGVVVTLAGVLGDLAESLIKRDMKKKDSSSWLPGLGGVLDIVDSVIVAAPASFACWAAGLVGPEAN